MAPLVSVVMPSYNYGRFIAAALDSVFAQTYKNFEVIVVDDGSTDDSLDVLARYGDRIQVLRQKNEGPSAARNAGIRVARGRYVAFLDADDDWLPEKLSRQVALIESDPATGVVGCWIRFTDANGVINGGREYLTQASDPIDFGAQLRGIAVRSFWVGGSGSGALVRRDVFDNVGAFDPTLRAAEDWDLWFRIGSSYAIRNVPVTLASICRHGISARNSEAAQWKVCQAALARWPDQLKSVRRRMQALVLADAGAELVDLGDTKAALRRYLASMRYHPGRAGSWHAVGSLLLRRIRGT